MCTSSGSKSYASGEGSANIGTPKNIYFPFGTNGKLMTLDVPIPKHYWVISCGDLHVCVSALVIMG